MDSFYAGLNALSLLTITLELAKKLPDSWENLFDTDADAKTELNRLELESQRLVGAVGISLDAAKQELERKREQNPWVAVSAADYLFLTSNRSQLRRHTSRQSPVLLISISIRPAHSWKSSAISVSGPKKPK